MYPPRRTRLGYLLLVSLTPCLPQAKEDKATNVHNLCLWLPHIRHRLHDVRTRGAGGSHGHRHQLRLVEVARLPVISVSIAKSPESLCGRPWIHLVSGNVSLCQSMGRTREKKHSPSMQILWGFSRLSLNGTAGQAGLSLRFLVHTHYWRFHYSPGIAMR